MSKIKRANMLRYSARITILTLERSVFLFALVSRANPEKGIMGILQKSPNALP